jgi:hypothetical protein
MRDGRNEAQTSKRPRLGCSSRERVDCGMTSGYCRERARCDLGQDVLQETRISSRFPSHGRPRLISETGPINSNSRELGRELLLEWPHFLPREIELKAGSSRRVDPSPRRSKPTRTGCRFQVHVMWPSVSFPCRLVAANSIAAECMALGVI